VQVDRKVHGEGWGGVLPPQRFFFNFQVKMRGFMHFIAYRRTS